MMDRKLFIKKTGEQIGYYRNKCGFSQEKLAEMVGVERNTITRYENGAREPQLNVLVEIAKVLNVSILQLLPEATEETRTNAI